MSYVETLVCMGMMDIIVYLVEKIKKIRGTGLVTALTLFCEIAEIWID